MKQKYGAKAFVFISLIRNGHRQIATKLRIKTD